MAENPSGMLSKEQFIQDNIKHFGLVRHWVIFQAWLTDLQGRECWEYFYDALDKDKSGHIDFKEWYVILLENSGGRFSALILRQADWHVHPPEGYPGGEART
jgi:hypothetical protein